MFLILKPILFRFLRSESLKRLVIDTLWAYSKRSDNKIDDALCRLLETNLLPSVTDK